MPLKVMDRALTVTREDEGATRMDLHKAFERTSYIAVGELIRGIRFRRVGSDGAQ